MRTLGIVGSDRLVRAVRVALFPVRNYAYRTEPEEAGGHAGVPLTTDSRRLK